MSSVGIQKTEEVMNAVRHYNSIFKLPKCFSNVEIANLLAHLSNLRLQYKSDTSDNVFIGGSSLYTYPCILKIFKPSEQSTIGRSKSLSAKWPKTAKPSPIICASVQYMLSMNSEDADCFTIDKRMVQENASSYQCDCKTCLLLALSQYLGGGSLKLKKR